MLLEVFLIPNILDCSGDEQEHCAKLVDGVARCNYNLVGQQGILESLENYFSL